MTTAAGYPDWQHIDTKVGLPLVEHLADSITTSRTYGPFYVGNYPAVNLAARPSSSGKYAYEVDWASSSSFSNVLLSNLGTFAGLGGSLQTVLPVWAPWMQVIVSSITTPGGETVDISITPTFVQPALSSLVNPLLIQLFPATVAGGTTFTSNISRPVQGEAVMEISTTAPTSTIALQQMQGDGTFTTLMEWLTTSTGLQDSFRTVLSGDVYRVQVINNSASSQTYFVQLGTTA